MTISPIMREITVTADYLPLSADSLVGNFEISCLPSNAANVLFQGDDGSDVTWIPAEWHEFPSLDLNNIKIKGTPGDKIKVIGYAGFASE